MATRTQTNPTNKQRQKTTQKQQRRTIQQPKKIDVESGRTEERGHHSTPLEAAAKLISDRIRNSDDTLENRELISLTNALRQIDRDQIGMTDQPSTMSASQLERELVRTRERIEALGG